MSEPKVMADLLSKQYASVFSTPRNAAPTEEPAQHKICFILFDLEDIVAAIDELKANSSAGPDGFPAILLEKLQISLS